MISIRTTYSLFSLSSAVSRRGFSLSASQIAMAVVSVACWAQEPGRGQRVLGIDVSAWQGNMDTWTWNTLKKPSARAATGGLRDDSRFSWRDHWLLQPEQSCQRQSTGSEHPLPTLRRSLFRTEHHPLHRRGDVCWGLPLRPADIVESTPYAGGIANTGADEADHFIQMAGPWMRPGYLLPMFDLEAGANRSTADLSTFATDFSDRLYQQMGIRPLVYVIARTPQRAELLGGNLNAEPLDCAPHYGRPPDYRATTGLRLSQCVRRVESLLSHHPGAPAVEVLAIRRQP